MGEAVRYFRWHYGREVHDNLPSLDLAMRQAVCDVESGRSLPARILMPEERSYCICEMIAYWREHGYGGISPSMSDEAVALLGRAAGCDAHDGWSTANA